MISTAANFLPFPPFLLSPTPFARNTPLPLPPHKPHGLSIAASRRRRTESLISGASSADAGLEDDGDDYEEEEEEEEGELIPLQEMGRWLRNKPAGFGEGKDYDTAMEEKLLEEIERDRIAQAGSVAPDKKEQQKQKQKKDTLGVPTGTRVRVSNLPRKKNVHRNLQLAFKGFSGITSINPAVMGNRKTRDPICKGFAFVDLLSKEVADRFVLQYSKQSVLFGKVQKVITCSVVSMGAEDEIPENRRIGNHSRISVIPDDQAEEETVSNLNSTDGQTEATIEHVNIIPPSAAENLSDQAEEETVSNLNSTDGQTEMTIEHVNISPRSAAENLSDHAEEETVSNLNSTDGQTEATNIIPRSAAENLSEANADVPSSSDSSPSSQKKGKQVASKKKKNVKSNSASLPASMVRLNVKERSVLTGVFSKYGGKAVPVLSRKS